MANGKINKRDLFAELMEGVRAMRAHREGKVTLRTHTIPAPRMKGQADAKFFIATRNKFNVSRSVWAQMLHVSPRTVEKWEQGGQISTLAATLVELVARYPDTIERLHSLPVRAARGQKAGQQRKRPKGLTYLAPAKHGKRTAS
ncbi:MAG TPA: transcriptional regulator [Candidatus Angelobacter sp.]|jgi:putative transcriptional regulator|nr:transcriptional regulator [Candidatus Angelobacter sp.]